jgi:sugar/nucleoside kinase (ribokinase family)
MSIGRAVSLGVHILDILGRPVGELPAGQGSILIEEIRATAAGTAAGTSVDLARLGVEVISCGAIGDDALGDLLLALLKKDGVNTDFIVRMRRQRTSATILPIRPNGDRPALHAAGAAQLLDPSDIRPDFADAVTRADVLHVGGPDALGDFAGEPLYELVLAAKRAGAVVTVDVLRPGDPETLRRLAPILGVCDWFLPNEDQARRLAGVAELANAVRVIRGIGSFGVAITRGAAGCVVGDGGQLRAIPAIPVPVIDTTGCGDAFDAGFITGLLLGCDTEECAWLGVACGSLVATGLGSDAGLTCLDTAIAFLSQARPEVAASIAQVRQRAAVRSRATLSRWRSPES